MMGRDENNLNVSLVVRDKVTGYRQCPSTTFEEEEETKRGTELTLSAYHPEEKLTL